MPQDLLSPGRLIVGKNPQDLESFIARFAQSGAGVDTQVLIESYDATGSPDVVTRRARGTFTAPAIVQAGDIIGEYEFYAYTDAWMHCAEIRSTVCGAPAAGVIPDSDIIFRTTSGGGVDTNRLRIMPAGRVVVGGAATLTEAQITAAGTGKLWVADDSTSDLFGLIKAGTNTSGAVFRGGHCRGTLAAPATIANGDDLVSIQGRTYTNAWHDDVGGIAIVVDAAVVAGQRPSSRVELKTGISNAAIAARLSITGAGQIVMGAAAALTPAQVAAQGQGQVWIGLSAAGNAITAEMTGANSTSPTIVCRKARGTLDTPTTVAQYDGLIDFRGEAYTNAWHTDLGGIGLYVSSAIVAGQAPATVLEMRANAANTASIVVASVKVGNAAEGSLCIGSGTDTSHVLVVGASRAGGSVVRMDNNAGGGTADVLYLRGGDNATTGSRFLTFGRPDNSVIGSISQNAAATVAYNTSSDQRLKADIADSDKGLADLMQIRVRKFRYTSDPSNKIVNGFIAQELNAVFPDAVTPGGTAKACNCLFADRVVDGKTGRMEKDGHDLDCVHRNPWAVDYGRLSPIIIKAIQELAGRVAALEK